MWQIASLPVRGVFVFLPFFISVASPVDAADARLSEAYGRVPLQFEANRGQTRADVRFLARGAGYSLYLTNGEVVLVLARPNTGAGQTTRERQNAKTAAKPLVLQMSLVNAAPAPRVSGLDELPGQ